MPNEAICILPRVWSDDRSTSGSAEMCMPNIRTAKSRCGLVSLLKARTIWAEVDEAIELEWLSLSFYLDGSGDYRRTVRKFLHFES